MIRLIFIFGVLLAVWQIIKMFNKEATIEEARTIGLEEARLHIQSPILLEDYVEARGIPKEDLESMIERGDMPCYQWRQYVYVENRELIKVNK